MSLPKSHPIQPAAHDRPTVIVVEDDLLFRDALVRLLRTVGLHAEVFGSATELLASRLPDAPSCLVLDVRLPGLSGLNLQAKLAESGMHVPIVFITGHGDIPMSVEAMKGGALDFLTKPFRDQDLLDAVGKAIERDRERRRKESEASNLRARLDTLSPRERQVMELVTAGLMNKQVAAEIGLSEITVKIHRGSVMKKMECKTLADLVRMAESLGISPDRR